MTRFSHSRIAFLLALAAFALGVVPPGGTEKEFEESLQVVDRMIGSGKAKKAKEQLLATLDAHKDDAIPLYHLSEVQDQLRRSAFWSVNTKPEPKSLISGNLVSWSATSGEIKLHYLLKQDKQAGSKSEAVAAKPGHPARPEFADFFEVKRFWVHPLAFEGPFTIEVKGSAYPEFSEPVHAPQILVCADWNRSICAEFGLSSGDGRKYVPAELLQIEGEDSTKLDQAMPPGVAGTEYVAKVVVTTSTVTAYLDDKRLLSAPRSGPIEGQIAFANFRGLREVVITGKVTPSWLMNVVDDAVQQRWSAFEKTYKPVDDLPPWLRERAWGGVRTEIESEDALPDEKTEKGRGQLEQFAKLLHEQKWQSALEAAEKAPGEDLSESTRSYLRAIALRRLGRWDESLDACSKACTLDPRCLPARRMQLFLEAERKKVPDLIEGWRLVVADFPKEPAPYVELAKLLLLAGQPDQARTLVRTAIDAGVAAGTLEATEALVSRALRGPVWPKTYEYKSEHYTVASDISQKLCFDAASLLEKFYTKFDLHLRHVPRKEKHIFRVYLFSGRAGYEAYMKGLGDGEIQNTAGLYSPIVKQLLIWNLPNSESILETIRHEGFHQYFDDLAPYPPRWLNEGLAVYYEGSKLVKGSWSDGDVREEQVAVLAKQPLVPLRQFLRLSDSEFLDPKKVYLSYAESWAFVHFLLSTGAENRKLFDRLLDALIAGARGTAAIDQVFTDAVTARLDPEFATYVRGLH